MSSQFHKLDSLLLSSLSERQWAILDCWTGRADGDDLPEQDGQLENLAESMDIPQLLLLRRWCEALGEMVEHVTLAKIELAGESAEQHAEADECMQITEGSSL